MAGKEKGAVKEKLQQNTVLLSSLRKANSFLRFLTLTPPFRFVRPQHALPLCKRTFFLFFPTFNLFSRTPSHVVARGSSQGGWFRERAYGGMGVEHAVDDSRDN